MKLYATTTSERGKDANKGGNEYLKIIIRDEAKRCVAYITIKPDMVIYMDIIEKWRYKIGECLDISTNDDTKQRLNA
jgi:hypothetical protein